MTVANLSDVLHPAMRGGHAVAGLVVLGWEDALAYVAAAEAANLPVILQAGPGARAHMPTAIWGQMFRYLAERASVPVVAHLDHAYTFEECEAGVAAGFTSIMIDGSKLPIVENIALTRRVVALAHPYRISVEGEVGVVGYAAGAVSAMTDPEEVARFDRESGADAVAISIGNVHLQTEPTDGINFEVLRAIEAVTTRPLVLHGGSGIPPDVRRKLAHSSRVCKLNIGTELRLAFGKSLRETMNNKPDVFDRISILKSTIPALTCEAQEIIEHLGPLSP
jgi:fructose-bisphosphate aldolase, class II